MENIPQLPEDVFAEISRHCDAKTWLALVVASRTVYRALTRKNYLEAAKMRLGSDHVDHDIGRDGQRVRKHYHKLPNGEKHGPQECWAEERNFLGYIIIYVHGKRHGLEQVFSPHRSDMKLYRIWEDDVIAYEWMWHPPGHQLALQTSCAGPEWRITIKWDEKGRMTECAHWSHGKYHGYREGWLNNERHDYRRDLYVHGKSVFWEEVWFDPDGTGHIETTRLDPPEFTQITVPPEQ